MQNPHMHSLETMLAAVGRLPAVKVHIDDARRSASVQVGARVVGRIDLETGGVDVYAPPDRIPTLQRAFPSCRATADGIGFDRIESQSSEALAALRRRANVERLAWQFRVASP